MKARSTLLTTALLLSGWGAAQTDPFQRGVPSQTSPSLRSAALSASPASGNAAVATATPPAGAAAFGNPRSSSDGSITRVVFDLPSNLSYTLTPTFSGLRIDVQGVRVVPGMSTRLGTAVSEYRAGGGQATLVTPFPLSLTEGWRATEATIAGGTRVLILEFGGTLSGGAGPTVKGRVLSSAPTTTPAAQATLNAPIQNTAVQSPVQGTAPVAGSGLTASTPQATVSSSPTGLPPGDTVRNERSLPPAPALPGASPEKPSALSGRVPGSARSATLTAPRLGKNPGLTRVVLDLPPGATYRLLPGPLGLRVDITGVNLSSPSQMEADISPELRGWRYDAVAGGVNVSLLTGTPTTVRSGWRAQLLSPTDGSDRYRLAIDFSPALADTTPLKPSEKIIASVPRIPVRGTAVLALTANTVKPRVVLDPGHGGIDPGAVGSIVEKAVTLDVALRVRSLLEAAGVEVIMTRESDMHLSRDKNTDLTMRAAMGNNAQMYVSIHVNAMPAVNALRGFGIETWWNPNHPLSQNLAALLQKDTLQTTAAFDQGLKNTRSLAVLRNSRVPAALIEVGYTSHPVDGQNLKDTNYLDRLALGIATGIRDALITGITADNGVTVTAVGGAGK